MNKPHDKGVGDGGATKDTPDRRAGTPGKTPGETPSETPGGPTATKPVTTTVKEVGGRGGLDPTRYGDWEKNGRAIDF